MSAIAKTNSTAGSKKPRKRRATTGEIVIIEGAPSGKRTGKVATRRNPSKQKKTANDVMLDAWEYTYKTRERRLTKP